MKNLFTTPKLAKFPIESGKLWYVWFRFNGGNPIRIYTGLNTIPDYEGRLNEGLLMAKAVDMKLKSGWVPDQKKEILTKKLIIPAFEEAINRMKSKVSRNTFDAYSGSVNVFTNAITQKKFNRMMAANFTRAHAKQCLEWIKKDRDWSANSYNKNLSYLRSVFHEIIEAEQAQINPFREIKNLKIQKQAANIPPTDEEMALICDELKAKNHGFYIFYMLIYYSGLRPDEARNLQVKNIDIPNKLLHIKGKTGIRMVPLIGNTLELLKPAINFPDDYYVFGTWVKNGGRHSRKNWFSPNPYRIKEDTPNKEWKKLIKDGLKINKSLYSGKHKGADDKLAAGMDIQTICDIFGHSETKMTERYAHSLKLNRFEAARKIEMKKF